MSWRSKSYEVLPALSVRGPELRSSLRTVTMAWMFGIVWFVCCTTGSHVQVFARMTGFGEFAFGVMAAIPFLASFGQIIASVLIERTGLRKYQFLQFNVIHRAAWLLIAGVPLFLDIPSPLAVWLTLAILMGSYFAAALAAPAWFSWMGDLIPRRVRGRYFARRERFTLMVQIVVVVALGILFDRLTVFDAAGKEAIQQPAILHMAMIVYAIGAVFGVLDTVIFLRIRELRPPRKVASEPILRWTEFPPPRRMSLAHLRYDARYLGSAAYQLLLDPLKDRVFRNYVLFAATLSFSATASGWYFWSLCLEHLHFGKLGTNMLFQVIGPLSSIAAAPFWGKLIDRFGRRPVLTVATILVLISNVPWFLAMPNLQGPAWMIWLLNGSASWVGSIFGHGNWQLIGAATPLGSFLIASSACVIGGCGWTGIGISQMSIMVGFSDGKGRSKYLAASSVLISVGGVAGGVVGGLVSQGLVYYNAHPLIVGPFIWNNWHATMVITTMARVVALFFLRGMPDPGSRSVSDMMRFMRVNVQNAVTMWLFYPLRVLQHNNGDEQSGRGS